MSDHYKNRPSSVRSKIATVVIGLCACMAAPVTLANEGGEVFALTGQPAVLFDGGSGSLTGVHNGIPYEIIQGYAVAQGDMVLGQLLANGKLAQTAQSRGIGQASAFERWPDGVIPYQFADSVTQTQRDRAQNAIAQLNAKTKIKLISRNNENAGDYEDYLNFELSGGCASYVGRKGGEQTVWLADSCTVGSIIHEIGHAIGLFHEHTRPDRDSFVTVHLNNVSEGKGLNFDKIEAGANNYSEYDYGSIMHYGEYFFSSNGERSISVPDGVVVGQRDALSDKDIFSINEMYATDLRLGLTTSENDQGSLIDLVVANAGTIGANTLKLTANWGDDADWLSISAGSGWECQQFGSELRCTRFALRGNSESSFSLLVNANGRSTDDLQVNVVSRTKDQDLNNNVFNDTVEASVNTAQPTPVQSTEPTNDNTDTESAAETDGTQTTSSATGGTTVSTSDTPKDVNAAPQTGAAQAGDSGGGGAAYYLLMLALGATLRRRR